MTLKKRKKEKNEIIKAYFFLPINIMDILSHKMKNMKKRKKNRKKKRINQMKNMVM